MQSIIGKKLIVNIKTFMAAAVPPAFNK